MRKKRSISALVVWMCVDLISHATMQAQAPVTLQSLIQMADTSSTAVRLSEHQLEIAQAGVKQARNQFLPKVSMDFSGSYIGNAVVMSRDFSTSGTTEVIIPGHAPAVINNGVQPTPHWGNNFAVEAAQIIYSGGALAADRKMAETDAKIAEVDLKECKQDLHLIISGYYLEIVKNTNQQRVLNEHIALTDSVLRLMQARQKSGVILNNDLTRYELKRKQLELGLIQLQDAASVLQNDLQTMLHITQPIVPDTTALESAYVQLTSQTAEAAWQKEAMDNNLDIRRAEYANERAAQQAKAVRSASIPTVAAIVRYQLWGPYTGDLIPVNANINTWFVGIGIHYELGSLWHNRQAIRQAKVAQSVASDNHVLAKEQVSQQVHGAYVHFLTSFAEVYTQEKQVQLATENYDLVEKRYRNDLALLTDLLDASSMLLQAEIAFVNARMSLLYNYFQLKYTTHTL